MATIAIPCEPRVLVNGMQIAQSLLDSVAAESRNDHDIWLLLPYRAKAAAEPMLKLLRNQFRSLKTIELLTPVSGGYALVTHMFARLIQVLDYEAAPDERAIIWVSERGNETFKPGAIDALDAAFWRKKCDTVGLRFFTIPATTDSAESRTLDGTFVISSQLAKKYPQRVPYTTIAPHFRLFLDKVLTEKCHMLDPDGYIEIGLEPDAAGFTLPQSLGETIVTSPAEVTIASFSAKNAELMGTEEQRGGANKAIAREPLHILNPGAEAPTETEPEEPTETETEPEAPAPKKGKAKKTMGTVVKPEEDPESEYV